ncbi:MAG: 3-oxoacyl-ACP synthase III family protein [Gammaproteobacteria bacterium]
MVGIIDFEVRFPSARASVAKMHAASGVSIADIMAITHCDGFPVLADNEQEWQLAVQSCRTMLARNRVVPTMIGNVIYAGSGEWETPFWSPAAKAANELSINDAHCFEVTNFCNAATAAVQIAADKIALGRTSYVLVLLGDRLSQLVDHGDPDSKMLFNFGDASAAVLLGQEDLTFKLLHSAMRTDPSWCDYYCGEREEYRVLMRRRGRRQGLANAYIEAFSALVADTLAALDKKTDDIAYFLINQGDKGMHERLLQTLGIRADKSVFNYDRLGHMGTPDTLIALQEVLTYKRMKTGDLILLATSGMGFSWGITALEYVK